MSDLAAAIEKVVSEIFICEMNEPFYLYK